MRCILPMCAGLDARTIVHMVNPLAVIAVIDTVARTRRAVRGAGPDRPLPNRRGSRSDVRR